MKKIYNECHRRMKDASLLSAAAGLAGWDQETKMPRAAAGSRAEQLSALSGVVHERVTDPKLGAALRKLAKDPRGLAANQRVCIREWLRDYEHAVKLPEKLVRELARVTSLAQNAWIEARKRSDFKAFAPWLTKVIDLKREEAEALGYEGIPYDALLDTYEPYMTAAELDPIVAEIASGLAPMIRAMGRARKKPSAALMRRRYPEADQEVLCEETMGLLGVRRDASRLDRSAHPFCCGMSPTDVRITTRYNERWLPQALYGVIHESGHALYEQGLPEKEYGTPLGEAVSLGIHESQSRMWENIIGRSLPFAKFMLPRLKKRFRGQLKGATANDLYRSLNVVAPSPIRVEADEVTYNLHIALRYELEKGLIAGEIKVRELPGLWNEGMVRHLGIRPKNDAEGVLQDTHWASGLVGYFPTYLLGNIYAAQLWARLKKEIPAVDGKISRGQLKPILAWLRDKVHRHGRRYRPAELVRRATGKAPSAHHLLDYLKGKYGEIYGISRW